MALSTPTAVYFDESSSTGENLLDQAQPVFALGSVVMEDRLAASLVEAVTRQLPAEHGEPKYITLAKTAQGRAALLDCLSQIPDDAARFYLAHKRFMIEAKIIDLLIEPMAHQLGFNIYRYGAAVATANLMHVVGPVLGDENAYNRMLEKFVQALRSKQLATIDELYEAIDAYLQTTTPEWNLLDLLPLSRPEAERIFQQVAAGNHRDELDPAVPCLVALVQDIGARIGPFRLIHDVSKVVASHALTLLSMHELPDASRPGAYLPRLSAITIEFADSKKLKQLQLADWIAGAGRQWATMRIRGENNRFARQLGPVVSDWLAGGIWPNSDI